MARTIETIKSDILESIAKTTGLEELTSTSKTSVFRALAYVIAVVAYSLEVIFDAHKAEVNSIIAEKKPHTKEWYRNLALDFRYGYALDSDTLDFSDAAKDDKDAAIIKYAACNRKGNELYLKIAKHKDGGLGTLDEDEMTAFAAYIERKMDAGINITIINADADKLYLTLDIWYDPMVLDGNGQIVDEPGSTPVLDAINNYLQNLTFNGEFSLTALTDALQQVDGVDVPRVVGASYKKAIDNEDVSATQITSKYRPHAGWLKIQYPKDNKDLKITWHATDTD